MEDLWKAFGLLADLEVLFPVSGLSRPPHTPLDVSPDRPNVVRPGSERSGAGVGGCQVKKHRHLSKNMSALDTGVT